MMKFAYNDAKNANTSHIFVELNYDFYLHIFFGDKINPHSKSHFTHKLAKVLRKLMSISQQNLLDTKKL